MVKYEFIISSTSSCKYVVIQMSDICSNYKGFKTILAICSNVMFSDQQGLFLFPGLDIKIIGTDLL